MEARALGDIAEVLGRIRRAREEKVKRNPDETGGAVGNVEDDAGLDDERGGEGVEAGAGRPNEIRAEDDDEMVVDDR